MEGKAVCMAEMPRLQRSIPSNKLSETSTKRAAFIGTRRVEEVSRLAHAVYLDMVESAVREGCTIRTGAAPGADQIAAMRALCSGGKVELVLPWPEYEASWVNEVERDFSTQVFVIVYDPDVNTDWSESVRQYHPAAHKLYGGVFSLHARNYGIIEPCEYVVALTAPDRKGGTEQGIRIAKGLSKRCVVLESRNRDSRVVSGAGSPDPARVAGWVPFQLDCTVQNVQ